MIDLGPLFRKEKTLDEVLDGVGVEQLRDAANEVTDTILGYIADSTDADVVFVPQDPDAHDAYASDDADTEIAWTLGHLVVHVAASSEEAAFLAAEMARGVDRDGRSRYETPWETVSTIQECRDRLEESRRMLLATLDVWPDEPHLDILKRPWPTAPELNAYGRFISGLGHATSHYAQIQDVVAQAKETR